MGNDGLQELLPGLAKNKTLRRLCLAQTGLGKEGPGSVVALLGRLSQTSSVRHLDLSLNALGASRLREVEPDVQAYQDAQALHKAIQHAITLSGLEVLDLWHNPVAKVAGAKGLLASLSNPTLRQACVAIAIQVRLDEPGRPVACADLA